MTPWNLHFYYNFIQTLGILDGTSHYTKFLSVLYDTFDTSDVTRLTLKLSSRLTYLIPFNTVCRALTLDAVTGYACGLKNKDVIESTCAPLSNMYGYFHTMHTWHAILRYTLTGMGRFASKRWYIRATPSRWLYLIWPPSTYGDVRLQSTRRSGRSLILMTVTSNPRWVCFRYRSWLIFYPSLCCQNM